MRDPHGGSTIVHPEFGTTDYDMLSCIHCGSVSMTRGIGGVPEVMVFRVDGTHYMKECGYCRSCSHLICPKCVGKPCSNRFRRMEQEEAEARKFICA